MPKPRAVPTSVPTAQGETRVREGPAALPQGRILSSNRALPCPRVPRTTHLRTAGSPAPVRVRVRPLLCKPAPLPSSEPTASRPLRQSSWVALCCLCWSSRMRCPAPSAASPRTATGSRPQPNHRWGLRTMRQVVSWMQGDGQRYRVIGDRVVNGRLLRGAGCTQEQGAYCWRSRLRWRGGRVQGSPSGGRRYGRYRRHRVDQIT